MILCPRCDSPTSAENISAMYANHCDHCELMFFLIYNNDLLYTIHFSGDTQFLYNARLLEEHGFKDVEVKRFGIFKHTEQQAFPTCEHCGQERCSGWELCLACQTVLGISALDGDRVLEGLLDRAMEPLIRSDFPHLRHLLVRS